MTDFDRAFAIVLDIEKGYVNDPNDPGGETNHGVTAATLARAIADGLIPEDVTPQSLTPDQAKTIYLAYYWRAARCHELPWPLSLYVFDAAVNQGAGTAIKLLQKAAGVAQDGIFGKQTARAIASQDTLELASLFMADRGLRYTGTRNFDRYGRGWFKRLFKIAMSGV